MKMQNVVYANWTAMILLAILNHGLIGLPALSLLCALLGVLLSFFYFYFSVFYFSEIPINNLKSVFKIRKPSEVLAGLFAGFPQVMASISFVFLVLLFPGSHFLFVVSILGALAYYLMLNTTFVKGKIPLKNRRFILKELRVLFIFQIGILLLIYVTWELNPFYFEISPIPSDAPRY
jgi:hypothetical protein